ncbi:hypothetical protein M569_06018, partial [Genlisea aurea]
VKTYCWLCGCRHHGLSYRVTAGDEVEDMLILLKEVQRHIPSVSAVSSGAIESDYQRLRVENVCSRLGLVSLAYLWKQDQSLLLREMRRSDIEAIIVKVAAIGLDPFKHLGKKVTEIEPHLHKLKELYGINVCGEGGEYETLTLDCPLFKNARIVIDKSQVILHSPDKIAPVGVLHPLEYHLEKKSASDDGKCSEAASEVCEVLGDCLEEIGIGPCRNNESTSDFVLDTEQELRISKSKSDGGSFSIACLLQGSSSDPLTDLRKDLRVVLTRIESLLAESKCSWENVLYVHLYIADMNGFSAVNDEYVETITHEKCRFGVPSRSTVELPLLQCGMGKVHIEVLVSKDNTKNVLHVQSISEWAPSCIGPYSQASFHKDVLYMAGQLGLNPATMLLSGDDGPAVELQTALENSEAVAKCFNSSISTSAVALVIYCSASLNRADLIAIENQKNAALERMKQQQHRSDGGKNPVCLFILVPDLPKRASVEVKPLLYCGKNWESPAAPSFSEKDPHQRQAGWGFDRESWHGDCLQKCIVDGILCTAAVSITQETSGKILPSAADPAKRSERTAKFCIYLLDGILTQNGFSWGDVTNLRVYFRACETTSYAAWSTSFAEAMRGVEEDDGFPLFNLVPVLGSGKSASSMDDILTCELFARKF